MATNRILEFSPSQEEAIVARILVLLHQAVDEHFPSAEKATRQFTKTVFSEDDSERTAVGAPPQTNEPVRGFGSEEKTGPGEHPPDGNAPPSNPPPPPRVSAPPQSGGAASAPPVITSPSQRPASAGASAATALSDISGLSEIGKKVRDGDGPDWITRVTLALLIAGLILLAYSFLV